MIKNQKPTLSLIGLEIGFTRGSFSQSLIQPINCSAIAGELIAVIGRNGIGKSTLLRTITGLHQPVAGDIFLESRQLKEYSRIDLSSKVGYISTEIVKVSNMRVYDLVALGRFPHTNLFGRISKHDEASIEDAIEKTGMSDLKERPVTQLSDGERQRAMIAMVLAQDAQLMVLDEPTAFLDISSRYEIIHLMHNLTRSRNKTIVFSTHDLNMAVNQADKIWLLKEKGAIEGAPEDLMLDGSFSDLFDESKVRFNSSDGSFSIRGEERGTICVDGQGDKKYWTERALTRAGYIVVSSATDIKITVPSEDVVSWTCNYPGGTREFGSIYELVDWIRDLNLSY